jgi:hypothetical protein
MMDQMMPPEEEGKSKAMHPMSAPIPGEAWTVEPGAYPYERPPQFTDLREAFNYMFPRIMEDETAEKFLSLMEMGVSVETLSEYLAEAGASEGLWSIPLAMSLALAIAVLLVQMAKAAGIKYKLTNTSGQPKQPSEAMVQAAMKKDIPDEVVDAAQQAATKAKPEAEKKLEGFIKRK